MWSCGRKLRVPFELRVDLGDRLCLLREDRSPFVLQGAPRDSSHISAGVNRASSQFQAGNSGFLSISDFDCRVSASSRLVSRNSMLLSSGDRVLGVAFKVHLGSQASSRVEAKNFTLLSICDRHLSWSPLSGLKGVKPPVGF